MKIDSHIKVFENLIESIPAGKDSYSDGYRAALKAVVASLKKP